MNFFTENTTVYQDPHINYSIDPLDLPFKDYIANTRAIIASFKTEPYIIDANIPYELRPTHTSIKKGVLLIHGLLDTPFVMKDIGIHLQSQGMLVRAILLPGHGTVPGALLHVPYEDWLKTVKYGVLSLLKEVESVFLVGFSTGALLSVHHALQNATDIAGLILLSPAFRIRSSFTPLSRWHAYLPEWFCKTQEIDYTKYRSIPFNAIYQVYRLGLAVITSSLTCPLFMAISHEDKVVSCQAALNYFANQTHPKNKAILYAQHPQRLSDPRVTVRYSIVPEWNIINYSHIAIPVSSDNFHYGKKGDFPLASHVEQKNSIEYGEATRLDQLLYNTLYQLKLRQKRLERLTFNPDFDYLKLGISEFILSIP